MKTKKMIVTELNDLRGDIARAMQYDPDSEIPEGVELRDAMSGQVLAQDSGASAPEAHVLKVGNSPAKIFSRGNALKFRSKARREGITFRYSTLTQALSEVLPKWAETDETETARPERDEQEVYDHLASLQLHTGRPDCALMSAFDASKLQSPLELPFLTGTISPETKDAFMGRWIGFREEFERVLKSALPKLKEFKDVCDFAKAFYYEACGAEDSDEDCDAKDSDEDCDDEDTTKAKKKPFIYGFRLVDFRRHYGLIKYEDKEILVKIMSEMGQRFSHRDPIVTFCIILANEARLTAEESEGDTRLVHSTVSSPEEAEFFAKMAESGGRDGSTRRNGKGTRKAKKPSRSRKSAREALKQWIP